MKNRLPFKSIILALLLGALFTGCKKEGPPGPEGKVKISSYIFTASSWSSNSSRWYYNFPVEALTSTNIDSSSVQVYFSDNESTWTALPYTAVASTNYFMNFQTSAGNVQVQWIYNGIGIGDSPNTFYGTTLKFKVVVIPSSQRVGSEGFSTISQSNKYLKLLQL